MTNNYQSTKNQLTTNNGNYAENYYQNSLGFQLMTMGALVILCLVCLFPEVGLATSIESQLEKASLLTGKVKTVGITGSTICAFIWAMFRGRPGLAGAVVAIGVVAGFYLEWVAGGLKVAG